MTWLRFFWLFQFLLLSISIAFSHLIFCCIISTNLDACFVSIMSICGCTNCYYYLYHSICVGLLYSRSRFFRFGFNSRFLRCVKSISFLSLQRGVIMTHTHTRSHNTIVYVCSLYREITMALLQCCVKHTRCASDNQPPTTHSTWRIIGNVTVRLQSPQQIDQAWKFSSKIVQHTTTTRYCFG